MSPVPEKRCKEVSDAKCSSVLGMDLHFESGSTLWDFILMQLALQKPLVWVSLGAEGPRVRQSFLTRYLLMYSATTFNTIWSLSLLSAELSHHILSPPSAPMEGFQKIAPGNSWFVAFHHSGTAFLKDMLKLPSLEGHRLEFIQC